MLLVKKKQFAFIITNIVLAMIKTPDIGSTVHTVIVVLQKCVDLCLDDTIDDDNHSGPMRIPHILLQCLDILLEHLPASNANAIEVWLNFFFYNNTIV